MPHEPPVRAFRKTEMVGNCGENRPFERTFVSRWDRDGNGCLWHLIMNMSADCPVDLAVITGIIVLCMGARGFKHFSLHFVLEGGTAIVKKIL